MIVWNGIEGIPEDGEPFVATIGNFDGVHVGHRAIIDEVASTARSRGVRSMVVTFEPHPAAVVAPGRRPPLIQTRRQKLEILDAAGLDAVLILRFDARLASLGAEEFLTSHLGSKVRFSGLRVGASFRFGRAREGDVALLEKVGGRLGFDAVTVPPVSVDGMVVSSSAIRRQVQDGDVAEAERFLGRPFAVGGEVVRGAARGRGLDFPTCNIRTDNELLPRRGVYVTETVALATVFPSVTNVGVRPTFDGTELTVETHLVDFEDDLYGERIEIRFLARLRDEHRFDTPSELADQIARDRAAAVAFFQRVAHPTP